MVVNSYGLISNFKGFIEQLLIFYLIDIIINYRNKLVWSDLL